MIKRTFFTFLIEIRFQLENRRQQNELFISILAQQYCKMDVTSRYNFKLFLINEACNCTVSKERWLLPTVFMDKLVEAATLCDKPVRIPIPSYGGETEWMGKNKRSTIFRWVPLTTVCGNTSFFSDFAVSYNHLRKNSYTLNHFEDIFSLKRKPFLICKLI